MISPEAAIEHFSRILRAANSEPSAQISGVQSRVLGAAAARGRTFDGSIMGWLMQEFSQSIKQTVEKSVAEAKRVFSIAGMPADEGTKAKVQELVWSTASTLIRAIDESLTPVLACNPTVPRPRPISELLEPVRLACLSELELFFTAARVSVSNQRLLQAGQVLDANLMLLAIFANALSSIDIIDPYIGCRLFAILSAKQSQTQVKIIYADGNLKPADAQCLADFQRQYGGLTVRQLHAPLHDRFIIIDSRTAYSAGHSLKDLGSKDTVVTQAPDPNAIIQLFNQRWGTAV